MTRLAGAPQDIVEACLQFLAQPQDVAWRTVGRHIVHLMSTAKTRFREAREGGSVQVGFIHPRKNRERQAVATLSIRGDLIANVFVGEENAGKLVKLDDLVTVKPGQLFVHLDIPLSIIWGGMSYEAAVVVVKDIAKQYEEDNSQVRLFEQQMVPLAAGLTAEITTRITNLLTSIGTHEQEIRRIAQEVMEANMNKAALETRTNLRAVARGLVSLLESGDYTGIQILPDLVTAETKPIIVPWDGYDYQFGRFKLELRLRGGDTGRIMCLLLEAPHRDPGQSARSMGYLHPHIQPSGAPCLGNYVQSMMDLILRQQFQEALSVLMDFLCSYNPSNPYRPIANWMSDRDFDAWTATGRIPEDGPAPVVQELDLSHLEAASANGETVVIPPRPEDRPELVVLDDVPDAIPDVRDALGVRFGGDYDACWTQAKRTVLEEHVRLSCLDRPYGVTCDACPHRAVHTVLEAAPSLWDVCNENSVVETCMRCRDLNCPHIEDREDECLSESRELITSRSTYERGISGEVLRCVECPFDHVLCGNYGERFDNCWSIQTLLSHSARACHGCTVQACSHHPSRQAQSAS
jgi:hypothetical protein